MSGSGIERRITCAEIKEIIDRIEARGQDTEFLGRLKAERAARLEEGLEYTEEMWEELHRRRIEVVRDCLNSGSMASLPDWREEFK